jgi:hypothetical protein
MKIDQLFESDDDLASQFAKVAKEKGMNIRVAGTPEQEKQRTMDMLTKRRADQEKQSREAGIKDFANIDQLEAEYAQMKAEYKSLGGSNWQYADREQNLTADEHKARSMEDGLRFLWQRIQRAKKYGSNMSEGHPDEKEDKALIRKMVKQQALKKENMMAKEQHEDHEIAMATSELKNVYINAKKLFDIIKQRSEQEGLDAWQQSKITKASDYLNSVLTAIRGEPRR